MLSISSSDRLSTGIRIVEVGESIGVLSLSTCELIRDLIISLLRKYAIGPSHFWENYSYSVSYGLESRASIGLLESS